MSKNSNARKSAQLRENFSTACGKLKKTILFHFAQQLKMDICFRCNEKITSVEDFTLDHKINWLNSENPIELFYSIPNVAFSHKKCNLSDYKLGITGYKGVHFKKKRYHAIVYIKRKAISFGNYKTKLEAAKKYDEEIIKINPKAITNKSLGLIPE